LWQKKAPEEEYIDIKDILALPTPKEREKKGKLVYNGTPVITRSRRVVKVANSNVARLPGAGRKIR
jgi:hypothetical protein